MFCSRAVSSTVNVTISVFVQVNVVLKKKEASAKRDA